MASKADWLQPWARSNPRRDHDNASPTEPQRRFPKRWVLAGVRLLRFVIARRRLDDRGHCAGRIDTHLAEAGHDAAPHLPGGVERRQIMQASARIAAAGRRRRHGNRL